VSAPANVRSRRDRIAPKRRRRPPRDDAAKSARAQTVINIAGGKFATPSFVFEGADTAKRDPPVHLKVDATYDGDKSDGQGVYKKTH
jgi:hypothetical protein